MHASEAADVIDSIASAIRSNPAQFHLAINVTGQRITSYGGTGLSVSVTGGGPGSMTIGQKVSVSGADIEIQQQRGVQAFEQQLCALLVALAELSQHLRSANPDRPRVSRIVESLKGTWIPGVITSVVGNVISKSLGI